MVIFHELGTQTDHPKSVLAVCLPLTSVHNLEWHLAYNIGACQKGGKVVYFLCSALFTRICLIIWQVKKQ